MIEWAVYERANRRARQDYLLRTHQLVIPRVRDQRGRTRPERRAQA